MSLSLYFDRSKSWIWQTLEKVMNIFCKRHFHNDSKEVFLPKKFEFHARGQKCHFDSFKKLPKWQFWTQAWNSKKSLAKRLLLRHYKVPFTKDIHNFFQGPPNPGFRSVKVQIETFLKKDSRDFKNSFYLGFLWSPSKSGKQN